MGGRSRVAAQFLAGQGFQEVYNLKGGIKAWQGLKAKGPVELNLDLIRGDESQEEMVVIAYGLEKTLKEFYQDSAREDAGRGPAEPLPNLGRCRGKTSAPVNGPVAGVGRAVRG